MKLLRRSRYLWIVTGSVLSCAIIVVVYFVSAPIDERPGLILKRNVDLLTATSIGRYADINHTPRDFVAPSDPSCGNSWRMLFGAFGASLDEPNFDECWTSQKYDKLDDDLYRRFCISCPPSTPRTERYTQIMAVVGTNTPFTEFVTGQVSSFRDIPNDAVILLEVSNSKVPWMQAGDIQLADLVAAAQERNETLGAGVSPYGRWIAFADQTIWLLDESTPIAALLPFCTIDGAKQHDRERELRKYVVYELPSDKF